MPLEQRVKALVDGLETRLEDQYSIEAIEVWEARDDSAGGGVQAGCWSKALKKRAQWKRVADASSELAGWQRDWRLLDAFEKSAAGDRVGCVKDSTWRVDVDIVVVEIVVRVVWDVIASSVVQALLAAASLGTVVLMVSLLSKQPLGLCWARR
jgi:hypothetical protein